MAKAPDGFYILTDTQITIEGLRDPQSVPVNDAQVVGDLKDRSGKAVPGCEAIAFEYIEGSNGNYVGIVPANGYIKEGQEYDLFVTCTRQSRRMTVVIRRSGAYLYA